MFTKLKRILCWTIEIDHTIKGRNRKSQHKTLMFIGRLTSNDSHNFKMSFVSITAHNFMTILIFPTGRIKKGRDFYKQLLHTWLPEAIGLVYFVYLWLLFNSYFTVMICCYLHWTPFAQNALWLFGQEARIQKARNKLILQFT